MYLKSLCLLTIIVLLNVQCNNDSSSDTKKNIAWVKPQIGAVLDLGDKLPLQLDVSSNFLIDSVVYLIDTASILKVKDAQPVSIATDSLALGNRLITARVFSQGQVEEISTNIVLKSTLVPQKLTYKVVHTLPHDTSSYIEGSMVNLVYARLISLVVVFCKRQLFVLKYLLRASPLLAIKFCSLPIKKTSELCTI